MDYSEEEFHRPSEHISSDNALEITVKELLHNSKSLNASDLTVTAHNGNVTLSGTVKSEQEKDTAESLIQLVLGVGVVKNEIIVKLNEGILPSDVGRKDTFT